MVYGELGRFSLEIQIKKRMIGYWGRLIIGKESKLCYIYLMMTNIKQNG